MEPTLGKDAARQPEPQAELSFIAPPTVDFAALQINNTSKRASLRTATFDDCEQIAAVEEANGISAKPREQWLHLWQNNPAYQHVSAWPIGWVLEDEDGRIVGSLGNVPCLYRFGGRTYVAGFGRGWAVNTAYRALSLQMLSRQRRQPGVDLRLTTTASATTSAVLTNSGWSRVPVGQWDRAAFWVTNYTETVKRYLAAKVPGVLSGLAGTLLSSPVLVKGTTAARPRRSQAGCELFWDTDFDERFDRFWEELESRNAEVLLSVRTRQTLTWHFKYSLEEGRIWVLTACDGHRLLAYAIFERLQTPSLALTRMLLIDFQTLAKDPNLVSAMISYALERCRQENVHVLDNVGCWLEEKQPLVRRASHRRDMGAWGYWYQAANPELATALQNPEAWYPTQYDADTSL